MKTVYKYQLEATFDLQTVRIPAMAGIITFQSQHGIPTFWAIVDPQEESISRQFCLRATGQPIDLDGFWCWGTAQFDDLVFHLFEKGFVREVKL